MSVTYNFKINIVKRGVFNLSSMDIVEKFIEAGWSLYSEKKEIIYTDVGDDDDFQFLAKSISKKEYYNIIRQKDKNNEIIALALFYLEENHRYRIDILITPKFDIIITPDDATKKMIKCNLSILDVNWYLCRILPILTNKNMIVECFSYTQF